MRDLIDKHTIIKLKKQGISNREVSKLLVIDRKTVAKYWNEHLLLTDDWVILMMFLEFKKLLFQNQNMIQVKGHLENIMTLLKDYSTQYLIMKLRNANY